MSHSVFRDLDEVDTSGSRADVADNNIIVFINKDGDVQVDPNALQDLIVSANTETKSTVSVIRVSSPTPSMETDEDESSTKQSEGDNNDNDDDNENDDDDDDDDEENNHSDDDDSKNSAESNEDSDHDDASIEKSQKSKKKKKKNKVPGYGLTVEDFYNPEQAAQFATEIMNIAGITNPRQLKADYEHLRYIIQNDHCYTPYTYADSLTENKSTPQEVADGTKRDAKSKLKLPATPAPTSSTAKKTGRGAQSSNGLDRDTSNSARNRSVDDANSSNENTIDQNDSDEEEAESETDFSDFTASDTDNDRDSDLDFSVNDCHSKRAKKVKKRKIAAKRKQQEIASKKRRRSTIDFMGSDDGITPKGKKAAKLPKKALNTSAKSATAVSPAVSSTSKHSPVVTSTPRLTKVTYIKESPQTTSHDNSPKTQAIQKATSTTATPQQATPSSSSSSSSISVDSKTKGIIVVKQKDKKGQSGSVVSDMKSLFTPDVIKKNPTEHVPVVHKNPVVVLNATNKIPMSTPTPTIKLESINNKSMRPIIVHSITPRTNTTPTTRVVRMPTVTFRKVPKPAPTGLASEQDQSLDLINSLAQEQLNKSGSDATPSSVSSQTIVPEAISNIVKMLETSEASSSIESADLAAQPSSTSTNTIPITYSTTQSTHDSQMLPDELLESFVNSDYLSDDLMQHVAKLVEDKNLQEVIDQQMQDANLITSCVVTPTQPTIQTISVVPKQNVQIPSIAASTPTKLPEEQKPTTVTTTNVNIIKSPTTSEALTSMANKKGITIRRPDGRIITLPPIEKPTTRGAKKRATITPSGPDTPQKSELTKSATTDQTDVTLEQKSVPNTPTSTESAKNSPATASKQAKPIAARERRASVAVKRASTDSKPRRSLSISNPPPNISAIDAAGDDDDDDEEDGSDGSYNSEDDPHRLWCICRTPHNNRFMICCDKCEEWFHGKCVGITRKMGSDMEKAQNEWLCPNCIKKQQPSIKNIFPRKVVVGNSPKTKEAGSSSAAQSTTNSSASNCIVCSSKPSRPNSIYCSDDCIRKHATKTRTASTASESEATSSAPTTSLLKSPSDGDKKITTQPKGFTQLFKDKANHVVVIEKATGHVLKGKSAPTHDKLHQWLADNPGYEILKPGTPQADAFKAKLQQLKTIGKSMSDKELFAVSQPTKIQTKLRFEADKMVYVNPTTQKQVTTTATKRPFSATISSSPVNSKSPAHKSEPITKTPKLSSTPVQKTVQKKRTSSTPDAKTPSSSKSDGKNNSDALRESARKTLTEQLITRTKEISDPNAPRLTDAEIAEFVNAAELEMFEMFGSDTGMKYKTKYRTLMYNIKDRKNLTLFAKISSKAIEPKQLVRMSTEELASQELAKWRENENKHQLEMITKSELDMLACGNSYVLKTHKGEEVIQESTERITLDPSIPVEDLVSVLNKSTVSSSDAAAITTKDSRVDKYLSSDGNKSSLSSSSSKKDSDRSHDKKDRHESRSSGSSSSKHKRKRSRERHSSHSSHSHSHKDKSHDKDRKERSSGTDTRKDKKDHKSSGSTSSSSSNRSKHHSDKDRKRESTAKPHSSAPKIAKTDENSIIDKILKAQSTIDSILHPEEFKKTTEPTTVASVSSASATEGSTTVATLSRQPSAANESDQEPTSTVTIPSPPEVTLETQSTTPPPPVERSPIVWSGAISMVDVATFQVSLSPLSGSTAMIEFPKEFDVVGRINPDTVWEYLDKIRISKDIVLLKFSPRSSSDDDETAYSTFINYLDTRKRLGVIKIPSKMVKDFYIMPLTSHKSLPSILKTTTGFDLGADRPDLLLGIIVRNRISQTGHLPVPPTKHRQSIPFIGHKPAVTIPAKDAHYTPPSSPNMNIQVQTISKQVIKSTFSSNLDDDDEPYSPGGSDEDDLSLNTIPTSYLSSSTSANPIPDYTKPIVGGSTLSSFDKQQLEELNRQIEAEKKEIAMHLQTVDIDEPYSPTSSVSPPINTNLSDVVSNINIPANLADILKNVASFGSTATTTQISMSQYSASLMDTSDTEYVPVASATSSICYAPASSQLAPQPVSSQPSKLAQLTDEELLRLVPDEID